MTLSAVTTLLPLAIGVVLALALVSRRKTEAACAFTLLLPLAARIPGAQLVPATVAVLVELGALGLLVRIAILADAWFPAVIAALALIAVVASILAQFGFGLAPWQHRIIALCCWYAAAAVIALRLAVPQYCAAGAQHRRIAVATALR